MKQANTYKMDYFYFQIRNLKKLRDNGKERENDFKENYCQWLKRGCLKFKLNAGSMFLGAI